MILQSYFSSLFIEITYFIRNNLHIKHIMTCSNILSGKNIFTALTISAALCFIMIKVYGEQSMKWMENIPDSFLKMNFINNTLKLRLGDRRSNCYKINENDSYQICEKLPYTSTDCGGSSDPTETFLVPNVVHFIWIGNRTLQMYDYLALRGAAAIQKPDVIKFHYTTHEPQGELWTRAKREIPCLKLLKFEAPLKFLGRKVDTVVHQTDIKRFQILLEEGGIYVDSDAIIIRSLDPLRHYEFTIGRSIKLAFSSGVILSEPNSTFLQKWTKLFKNKLVGFYTSVSYRLHQTLPDLPIHIEETSMQRPNPWFDGSSCMYEDSFNISENYILHLHPSKGGIRAYSPISEDELRTHDTTYGAGARAALYGTQDLIFLTSEAPKAHNRTTPKTIRRFPAIELGRKNDLTDLL